MNANMGLGIKLIRQARCPVDTDVLFMNQLNFHTLISIIGCKKSKWYSS